MERLCYAFVLYCAAKLKGMKEESSRVRLWKILEGCNLKWVMLCYDYFNCGLVNLSVWFNWLGVTLGFVCRYGDFFKESQQFHSKIDQILRSRYGPDWEDQLEVG